MIDQSKTQGLPRIQSPEANQAMPLPMTDEPIEPQDLANLMAARSPSAAFPYQHKFIEVGGAQMAYLDLGEGDPIVFLHGAPESSYVWRNIIPFLEKYGRIIAPDLIGHGKSDKLSNNPNVKYKMEDHIAYLDEFFDKLDLNKVTFVLHDWGSAYGFNWAARHPDRVIGLAFMECVVAPFYPITKEGTKGRVLKDGAMHHYQQAKDLSYAKEYFVNLNGFVEKDLQLHTVRKISQKVMEHWREPFKNVEDREVQLQAVAHVSVFGDVPEMDKILNNYNDWLTKTDVPKLYMYGLPGEVSNEYDVAWAVKHFKNIETAYLGIGLHFIQEDCPEAIGRAIADWYRRNFAKDSTMWPTTPIG